MHIPMCCWQVSPSHRPPATCGWVLLAFMKSKTLHGDLPNLANRHAMDRVPLHPDLLWDSGALERTSGKCLWALVSLLLEHAPVPALSYKTQVKEVVTFPYAITWFLDPSKGKVWDWIAVFLLPKFSHLPRLVLITCSRICGHGTPFQEKGHLSSRSMLPGLCKTLHPLAEEHHVGRNWSGCPSASATSAQLSVPRWKNSPKRNSGHFPVTKKNSTLIAKAWEILYVQIAWIIYKEKV